MELEFVILVICLIGSGFFSGMETGIVSLNRVRLRHYVNQRKHSALILQDMLDKPDHMLGTTLVGTNLCNVAMTVVSASLAIKLMGSAGSWLSGLIITVVILIFGEYLPKAWFQSHPSGRTMRYARILKGFSRLFYPVSFLLGRIVSMILPEGHEGDSTDASQLTRSDVQYLFTHESGATPSLPEPRRKMINGVFELTEKTVRDIMIPRGQMVVIRPQTTIEEVFELARTNNIKTFPVYSEQEKRFTGIVNLCDLFRHVDDASKQLPEFIRPPQYIEEKASAAELIPRMRLNQQYMLLVRDANDFVTGFITTEVVLEEIVGPLYD